MSTINYTYNVIVDRFRQFADGHFQLRRFTHGEISQADLEKEAEWPWMHVKPRAINYSPGTRAFSFEIFISDLPRDKEDKTGYQAESITDCSLIFQDLINEIHLGQMFGDDVLLTRPVNSEPFVEQYTHTLTGVTGIIELSMDYDWSACSIPASWNYNTPTNSNSSGFGSLQFIESLEQNGVFVSLDNDLEAPGNSYYYGTNGAGVKGWYASQAGTVTSVGLTAGTGISVSGGPITSSGSITVTNSAPDQVVALTAGTGITTSGTYPNFTITNSAPSSGGTVTSVAALTLGTSGADLSSTVATGTTTPVITLNVPTASAANRGALSAADWATFNNKQAALVSATNIKTINGNSVLGSGDLVVGGTTTLAIGTTPITSGTVGRILFEGTGNVLQEDSGLSWNNTAKALNITSASTSSTPFVRLISNATTDFGGVSIEAPSVVGAWPLLRVSAGGVTAFQVDGARKTTIQSAATASTAIALSVPFGRVAFESDVASGSVPLLSLKNNGAIGTVAKIDTGASFATGWILLDVLRNGTSQFTILAGGNTLVKTGNLLIGTTTDAGYKLDVNGSVRTTGSISAASAVARGTYLNQTLVATANSDSLAALEINPTFTNGAFTGVKNNWINLVGNASVNFTNQLYLKRGDVDVLFASSVETQLKTVSSSSPLKFFVGSTSQYAQFFATTGNLTLQNGGTFTDAGYRLDVNGSVRTTGSISAASAVARGTYLNQTLVATANNDVLVGLDIQPTFTTGAFTGVQSIALRLPNGGRITNASTISGYNVYVANGETTLNSPSSTGTVGFQLSYGFVGRFMGTTGNFILQNGGTFTDVASSRLTINSTTQGFLPPRMTNAQRLAIATPAVGLIVYCTDVVEGLYINKSTGWTFII